MESQRGKGDLELCLGAAGMPLPPGRDVSGGADASRTLCNNNKLSVKQSYWSGPGYRASKATLSDPLPVSKPQRGAPRRP